MTLFYSLLISGAVFFAVCALILRYSRGRTLSFFDDPRRVKQTLAVFGVLLVVLLGLDFVVHKHDPVALGNAPEFFAVYGFIACVVLIVGARVLRLLVKRDERYYEND
ncbi:hypothetical protein JCM14469_01590 [Desulfatiferula olefinivorans]